MGAHETEGRDLLSLFPLADTLDPARFRAALDERARRLRARHGEHGAATSGETMLLFSFGAERFALPLAEVREIRSVPSVTPLPGLPPFIPGLVSRRGRPLAVFDLARFLDVEAEDRRERLVLIAGAGYESYFFAGRDIDVGLLVGTPSPPSTTWNERRRRVSRGIYSGLVTLLDPERLLEALREASPADR